VVEWRQWVPLLFVRHLHCQLRLLLADRLTDLLCPQGLNPAAVVVNQPLGCLWALTLLVVAQHLSEFY
jgi:hypothetical protein